MSIDNVLILGAFLVLVYQIGTIIKLHREANPKKVIPTGYKTEIEELPELKLEGFGIVYKGHIVLNGGRPLIFDTYKEAVEYSVERGFSKPNSLFRIKKKVDVVWQKWNPIERTVFIGEVLNGSD